MAATGNAAGFADDHLSGVADGGGARERGNFGVGDAGGVGERVGEAAEAGAEDEARSAGAGGARQDELRGGFGECEWSVMRGRVEFYASSIPVDMTGRGIVSL